jgi:hypothetical protein
MKSLLIKLALFAFVLGIAGAATAEPKIRELSSIAPRAW